MKKLLVLAGVVVSGALAVFGLSGASGAQALSAQPACIVVNGPAGAHVQVGYAPNGPSDCRQI